MGEVKLEPAPALPAALAAQLPYARRLFRNGPHTLHFVDEGSGPVVVLQHGNPTWSYLWRRVIARLIPGGVRIIAPDLIGLGLSSKPARADIHTLDFHAHQVGALVAALELDRVTIVGQDWGGPILALMAARHPEWVGGAVFANTAIAALTRQPRVTAFHRFANVPVLSELFFHWFNFPVPLLHRVQGDPRSIGPEQKHAYRYPLRNRRERVAPLAFARMVPISLDHPTVPLLRDTDAWARQFTGPVQLVWGMRDPLLGPALKRMRALFPEAPVTETEAGHFLQEEVPQVLAEAILEVVAAQP